MARKLEFEDFLDRMNELLDNAEKQGHTIVQIEDLEDAFPELKERRESEDEQHRKWILAYLYDGLFKADEQFKGQFKTAIAWFEKQEHKSALSEEDEKVRKEIIALVKSQKEQQWHRDGAIYDRMIAWLERQEEPKQPKSIWHDVTEEPNENVELLCEWGDTTFGYPRWHDVAFYVKATNAFSTDSKTLDNVIRWCYVSDLM